MKRTLTFILALLLLILPACGQDAGTPAETWQEVTKPPETARPEGEEGLVSPPEKMMSVQYSESQYPLPGGYLPIDIARVDEHLLILGEKGDGVVLGLLIILLPARGE